MPVHQRLAGACPDHQAAVLGLFLKTGVFLRGKDPVFQLLPDLLRDLPGDAKPGSAQNQHDMLSLKRDLRGYGKILFSERFPRHLHDKLVSRLDLRTRSLRDIDRADNLIKRKVSVDPRNQLHKRRVQILRCLLHQSDIDIPDPGSLGGSVHMNLHCVA